MNKRVTFFTKLILLNLLLCSCYTKKTVNALIFYKVDTQCLSMGKIVGELRQNPLVGDYTTEVCAVPEEEYAFSKWSDGYSFANRKDIATEELFVTYVAYFEVAH